MKIKKLFDQTRKGFGECANKFIKVDYEHILSPDFKMTRKGLKFGGFHHDLENLLEKSGIFKCENKVFGKKGYYKADVWFEGRLYEGKTFFPSDLSRKQVIEKVMGAYDNFILDSAKSYELTRDGKYCIQGITNDGVEIEMYMTKKGKITSTYPVNIEA